MPNLSEAINDIHQDKYIILLNHIAFVTATLITIAILAIAGCAIYKLFDKSTTIHDTHRKESLKLKRYGQLISIAAVIFICLITGLSLSHKTDLANVYNAHISNNNLTIRVHQKRFRKDQEIMGIYYNVSSRIKHNKISAGSISPAAKKIKGKNSPEAMLARHKHYEVNKYNHKANLYYKKELEENHYLVKYMSLAKPHEPHWYNYFVL